MHPTETAFKNENILHTILKFCEIQHLFDLRLVNHFIDQVALLTLFKEYQRNGKIYQADKIFEVVTDRYPRKLSEVMIHETFQRPLRHVDQKEKYLLRYAAKFIDQSHKKKSPELKIEEHIDNLNSFYPLEVIKKLIKRVRPSQPQLDTMIKTEKPKQSINELFNELKTSSYPLGILNELEKRVKELTQEQLYLLRQSYDIPYNPHESFDRRESILKCLETFARNLDDEGKQSSRNALQELVMEEKEVSFTLARLHAHELSSAQIHEIIQLASRLLIHTYRYSDESEDHIVHRFTDFVYFLNQVKQNILAEDHIVIYNMFKFMVENHGLGEYIMYRGLCRSILNLGNSFTEPSLSLLIDYICEQFEGVSKDFQLYSMLIDVLNQLLPSQINDKQFDKLFTARTNMFYFLILNDSIKKASSFLPNFFARMSTEQIVIAKNNMIAIFNHFMVDLKNTFTELEGEQQIRVEDKKTAKKISNYFTFLGLMAPYFDAENVKGYISLAENTYNGLDDSGIQSFFNAIPHLFQKADDEDRRKLYHAMEKFGERYLFSSFEVMTKISNQLSYDLVQHYLQRIMKVEVKGKFAQFPCADTTPVLFHIIPLLERQDALILLHYLIARAEKYKQDTDRPFDLSDLIFRLLDSKKCTMEDLEASNLSKLSWGIKTLKVATFYNTLKTGGLPFFSVNNQQNQSASDKVSEQNMPTLTL